MGDEPQQPNQELLDLDEVLEFLAELPEEAVHEIIQLSRLQRQANHLRQSLSVRLQRKSFP